MNGGKRKLKLFMVSMVLTALLVVSVLPLDKAGAGISEHPTVTGFDPAGRSWEINGADGGEARYFSLSDSPPASMDSVSTARRDGSDSSAPAASSSPAGPGSQREAAGRGTKDGDGVTEQVYSANELRVPGPPRQELAAQRTRNSRTFVSGDGSTTVQSSVYSQNYFDGLAWQPIDTTIREERNASRLRGATGTASFTHSMLANNFKVRLNTGRQQQVVRFSVGDYGVTYRALSMASVEGAVYGNTVTYANAWKSTDMKYVMLNDEMKLELHLADPSAPKTFAFELEAGGVTPKLNEDGTVDFLDELGRVQFQIPRMWVKDAASDEPRFDRLQVQMDSSRGRNVLTLRLDDSGLQYPLVIDPTTVIVFGAMGPYHSLAARSDGTVWAWGNNASGQLGDNTTTVSLNPVQTDGLTSVIQVSAGQAHSLALKQDGTVWAWGSGPMVDGGSANRLTPVQIAGLSGIVAIRAGAAHSLALKNDGTVWAWGNNAYGQLGDGTTTTRGTPVQVTGLTSVVAVTGGDFHSLALKSDGTVWAWGMNMMGQLGTGTTTGSASPVQVGGMSGITAISAGSYHSLALKNDGTVRAWGYNDGALGDGTTTTRLSPVQVTGLGSVTAVSAGMMYSLALKSDGSVWGWGTNAYGQLGDGTATTRLTPVVATAGGVLFDTVTASYASSSAVSRSGVLYAWGFNGNGQLGNGTTMNSAVPVAVSLDTPGRDITPPGAVTLSVTGYTGASVHLAWTAATDDTGVVAYEIHAGGSTITVSGATTSYTLGLAQGITYSITVRAKDATGNVSAPSNTLTVLLDLIAPTPPSGLVLTENSEGDVTLTWTASTDNVGVTAYDIYRNDAPAGNTTGTSFTVSGLPQGVHLFKVRARDAAGNASAFSAVARYNFYTSVTYVYDQAGRLDYVELPSGQRIDYQYDANGNLVKIIYP